MSTMKIFVSHGPRLIFPMFHEKHKHSLTGFSTPGKKFYGFELTLERTKKKLTNSLIRVDKKLED